MKHIVYYLIIAIALFSCEKDKGDISNITYSKITIINPQDSAGLVHNQILDLLIDLPDYHILTNLEKQEKIIQFYEQITNFEPVFTADSLLVWVQDTVILDELAENLYHAGLVNYIQRDYINAILVVMDTTTSTISCQNELESIAASLEGEDRIGESDKIIIWGGLSIANHSLVYWDNDYQLGLDSPWNSPNKSVKEENMEAPWIEVAAHDVGGFFVGIGRAISNFFTPGTQSNQCYGGCQASGYSESVRNKYNNMPPDDWNP
jgi:hypothetical protein